LDNGRVGRLLTAVSAADCGAVVMGTGIVSLALSLDGRATLGRILLVATALAWLASVALLATELAHRRDVASSPNALTAVAGTSVLGAGLVHRGDVAVGAGLLVVALVLWLLMVPQVLRCWTPSADGAAFLLTVATQSLAVLASLVAARDRVDWLLDAALAPFLVGLALYPFVLLRFEFRHVRVGRGAQWVAGGALAISALAGAEIVLGAHALATLDDVASVVQGIAVVAWALAILWLPILVVGEALRARPRYAAERWATVFPVGMYAACSFQVGAVTHTEAMTDFARVWVWIAVAVWLVVLVAMVSRPFDGSA
jgi:tellurite resistance protein TehA-like permease